MDVISGIVIALVIIGFGLFLRSRILKKKAQRGGGTNRPEPGRFEEN